jgi:hypothetical protein
MPNTIPSNTDETIYSRDIIDRIEELRDERDQEEDGAKWGREHPEEAAELALLESFQEEAEGYADDWRHGVTLIRDSHFTEYARELVEEFTFPRDLPTWVEIDWEATAENVRADYTGVEFDGVTYWVR